MVGNLASELAGRVEVVWFGERRYAPAGVEVVPLARWGYPVLDLAPGRALARRAGVDVMHFTANTGWRVPGGIPFVLTVHDLIFMDTPAAGRSLRQVVGHRYARRVALGAIAAAHAVATPSATSAAAVLARGAPRRPPVVIPNGVDAALAERSAARAEPAYAVAFAGRDPRKGTELAVAGWRAAGWPGTLHLLAGAGLPIGLEAVIAAERARGAIVVHPYVERARLHEVLGGAAALIHPSQAEGFGLPVIEALAAGVPVIGGLAPASVEVAGEAIVPISPGEPVASIAAGLRAVRDDGDLRARLVQAGREVAVRHRWRAFADAYLELYRCAVG